MGCGQIETWAIFKITTLIVVPLWSTTPLKGVVAMDMIFDTNTGEKTSKIKLLLESK